MGKWVMTKMILAILVGASGLAMADDPAPKHKGPPQEALDACAKAKLDDACSFTHDTVAVKGTCKNRKHGTGLVCRKPHGPPPTPKTT